MSNNFALKKQNVNEFEHYLLHKIHRLNTFPLMTYSKADGYQLYQPQLVLQPIGEDIWLADGPNVPFGPGAIKIPFPTRMTVVKLAGDKLWVHSPIAPDEDMLGQLEGLGEVSHLVSPNAIHHLSLKSWSARYPKAKVWASPGVKKHTKTKFTDKLADTSPPQWSDEIDQRIARGSFALEEVVFFHRASRTLILTDLIENFEPDRFTAKPYRWLARFGKIERARPPIDYQMSFTLNVFGGKKRFRPIVQWMLDCQPEQIVIAHGKWFARQEHDTESCGQILKNAFGWAL